MNPIFHKFQTYDEFKSYLDDSDLIMCKRNFISPYCEYFGLLSPEGRLEAICVIQKQNIDKLLIKLFEVSECDFGHGLGTRLFNKVVDWFYNNYDYDKLAFELESLDDESDKFWEHLGFKSFVNEDGETLYKLIFF